MFFRILTHSKDKNSISIVASTLSDRSCTMSKKVWFEKGLNFACTACGKCCLGKQTNVFVNPAEVKAAAAALNMQLFDFVDKYTEDREEANDKLLTSIKNVNGACALLGADKKTCSIYRARPIQCRTYPFWTGNIIGEAEWKAEASRCEGISLAVSPSPSKPSPPPIQPSGIAEQLIVSQIHARGLGENWTYETSIGLLRDAIAATPNLIPDFLSDLGKSYRSVIRYESAALRVVDTTSPAEIEGDDEDKSDDDDHEPALVSIRRMDFASSPHVAQTEMYLTNNPTGEDDRLCGGMVDHARLVMRVHRAMHALTLLAIKSLDQSQAHIAVLGAGGCALPAAIRKSLPSATIFAVEPCKEVLEIAQKYFHMSFTKDGEGHGGVIAHECTGEDFIASLAGTRKSADAGTRSPYPHLDVAIIDTCGAQEGSTAPVSAMCSEPFLSSLCATLSEHGIVLMNSLGDDRHRAALTLGIEATGMFTTPVFLKIRDAPNQLVVFSTRGEQERVDALTGLLALMQSAAVDRE